MVVETKTIQWIHQNIQMKAILIYSSKDYEFKLILPFIQEFDGMHMLHMAPVAYTLLEGEEQDKKTIRRNGIHYINLRPIVIERCNQCNYSSLTDDGKEVIPC
jgi:hypothetical protein